MRRKEILEVVGRSCKRNELIEHLQTKNLSKDLSCGKDVNINIPKKWILLSAYRKAFSTYPWGRISYDTTIKHLLKAVKTIDGKTTNLYGFPWAFMCWAFEVVPFLQKKYKVFSKQVSSPRIFRWLLATNNESVNINELFDPPSGLDCASMNAKIESLKKAIVTMKSKRGIRQSSKICHPYTPDYVKRTKRQISEALSSARKREK
ncbi:hypothetical protein KY284_036592 [Solanum tuberosum]|nr:hypothetical protein KY284_036592 [Solanum tuberosum]